jgi:hypothetical protein
MATSWVGLISQVRDYLHRSDLSTAQVDYFIDNCENWLNNNLRVPEMETTNGSLTVSSGEISNPSDFLSWKRLTVASNGTTKLLAPLTDEQGDSLTDGSTGQPFGYVMRGSKTILKPTPDGNYTVAGTYYQKVPALSDSASTNWVISNYQDAYLYGSFVGSEGFIQNDQRIGLWRELFLEAVNGIRKARRKTEQIGSMTTEYPVY